MKQKKQYISPHLMPIEIQQRLLETVSGKDLDIGGDTGRPNASKHNGMLFDDDYDYEDDLYSLSWKINNTNI